MPKIIQVVRDALEIHNVGPHILEKVPSLVERAVVKLHNSGALPPKIYEFKSGDEKEERRDGNNNLMYNFYYLPEDFLRLDKFVLHRKNADDNINEAPYQHIRNDSFFNRRRDGDERKLFTILDYNRNGEDSRKILVADPFPEDNTFIEIRYDIDATDNTLEAFDGKRYWEPFIAQVEEILGIKNKQQTKEVVNEVSSAWRNQQGNNSEYNGTTSKTKVNNTLFGK